MIERVRRHFIIITMTMLTSVLLIPLCVLNLMTSAMTFNQSQALLEQIAQAEVFALEPPEDRPPDFPNGKPDQQKPQASDAEPTEGMTSEPAEPTDAAEESSDTQWQQEESSVLTYAPAAVTTTAPAHTTAETVTTRLTTTTQRQIQTPQQQPSILETMPPEENFHGTMPPVQTRQTFQRTHQQQPQTKPPADPWQPNGWHTDFTREENPNFYEPPADPWHPRGAVSLQPMGLMQRLIQQVNAVTAARSTSETTHSTHMETQTVTTAAMAQITEDKPPREAFYTAEGVPPNNRKKRDKLSTIDHFVVYLNLSNQVEDIFGTEDYDTETCAPLVAGVLENKKPDGFFENLQYVQKRYSKGSVIVFSDRTSDLDMIRRMLIISIGVFLLMEIIIFFLTRLLTKRAMLPMQVAFEKQQQFISDAGHELKTPLTIISANADILSDEIGNNKWLTYIRSQTERMRGLVQEMLDLMKITNHQIEAAMTDFNISSVVESAALPFESQAFEQEKNFQIDVQPDIHFFGNVEQIRRMVGIFIDNAFKYSEDKGTIQVELKAEGNKKQLSVYNTGIGIAKGEEDKIFERFYRSDNSRSRQTGSYGLGLAIAKSIADRHHIRIQVINEPGQYVRFQMTF